MNQTNKRKISTSVEVSPNLTRVEVSPEILFAYTPIETLTHLRVDSSVAEIPESAFEDYKALVQVQLPETLTRIGKRAFAGCVDLECVEFKKVGQIGDYAFYRCGGLKEAIVSSASTKLGIGAFQECNYLRFVQLPEGLQSFQIEASQQIKTTFTAPVVWMGA
eukprot:scaffold218_cov90-Cylindrotheca_fusiformis.AAC.1